MLSPVRPLACAVVLAALPCAAALLSPPSDDWVVVSTKSNRVALHPRTGEQRNLPPDDAQTLLSPDAERVVLLKQPTKNGAAELILSKHPPTTNATPDHTAAPSKGIPLPHHAVRDLTWTHDSAAVVFLADMPSGAQVCLLPLPSGDASTPATPMVLSATGDRCFNLRAASDGRIAWAIHREQRGKEAIYDLVIAATADIAKLATPSTSQREAEPAQHEQTSPITTTTLRRRVNLHTFEFSPDATKLAFAAATSLFIHDFPSDSTKEIKFSELEEKMYAHGMQELAWRRDSRALCGFVTFLGGRSYALGERPGEPNEFTMPGDLEVFILPLDAEPFWIARPRGSESPAWIPEDQLPAAPAQP